MVMLHFVQSLRPLLQNVPVLVISSAQYSVSWLSHYSLSLTPQIVLANQTNERGEKQS